MGTTPMTMMQVDLERARSKQRERRVEAAMESRTTFQPNTDLPSNEITREIRENMTCMDVLNYAHYVFYKRTHRVKFGGKEMSVEDVCSIFPNLLARSMAVKAEVGPPNGRAWRVVTLDQLLNDWYWLAKSAKNTYVMDKFRDALAHRGIKCKV